MYKYVKIFLATFICLSLFLKLRAQKDYNFDSLNTVLNKTNNNKAEFLNYLYYIDTLPEEKLEIIRVVGSWITKYNKYDSITAATKIIMGNSQLNTSRFKESTALLNAALDIAEKNNYVEIYCNALNSLATLYRHNEQLDESAAFVKRSLQVSEKNNYKKGIATAKYNLSGQFFDSGFPERRDTFNMIIRYAKEALQLYEEAKDDKNIIKVSMGLAESYADYDYFDSAFLSMAKVPPYLVIPANKKLSVNYYFFMGKIYNQLGRFNKGDTTNFQTSIKYLDTSLILAKQYKDAQYEMWSLDWTASGYKRLEDYKNAYDYASKYYRKHLLRINSKNFTEISDIQHQFEQERKDREIAKKSTLNKILMGSAAALLLMGLLGYRNFISRQKIQQQKITDLEKDKQLLAIDAMLKGQEDERSRIAKDLHDGLGGMLSGVKLSFVNMKENMVMDAESVQSFENSIMQLDNTIRELRKVAHNLMPEALVRFGLKNAVLDFCNSMQVSSKTKIIFEQMGTERQLSNTADLYIYRIIQELINNAVKHSACNQILVQLTKTTDKILLTVEDDGKGFNTQQLQHAEGIGMKNIQQRVNYFKGKMDITSQPGEGTSVNIELTA